MVETSQSLLQRLQGDRDESDWIRFAGIYMPLIRKWLHQQNVVEPDAEDLSQEVLTVITRKLAEFEHAGRTGSFRAWVKNIVINCLRNHWRSKAKMDVRGGSTWEEQVRQLEDPKSELSIEWNRQHDQHVLAACLELAKKKFEAKTWRAFEMLALKNESVDSTAESLQLSKNAVCVAKSRVLAAVRQIAQGFIEM